MSNAYAQRFRILPVGVNAQGSDDRDLRAVRARVGGASCAQILRLRDQARDRQPARHPAATMVEFYNLAHRSRARREQDKGAYSEHRQLRAAGRARQAAASSTPTTSTSSTSCDWLLQYAFEQRASDIHLEPRRDSGNVRFRIDGVLHQVYQIPDAGDGGDDQPHQDPRAHGRGGEAPPAGRPHQDRARPTATKSSCACRRCRPRSARSW